MTGNGLLWGSDWRATGQPWGLKGFRKVIWNWVYWPSLAKVFPVSGPMQLAHLDIKTTIPNDANVTILLRHHLHFCKNLCSVSSGHFCYHETWKPESNTKVGRLQCSTQTQWWIQALNLLNAQGPSILHLFLWSDAMKEPEKGPVWAGYPGSQDKSYCGLHFRPPEILLNRESSMGL